VVVSSHACGALTDLVIDRAIAARARVAVLPCCHVFKVNDQGALSGWIDGALAIDIMRVVKLEQNGYHVSTQTIPASVTPKNRLLLGTTTARLSTIKDARVQSNASDVDSSRYASIRAFSPV
jgi:hypothetical protein